MVVTSWLSVGYHFVFSDDQVESRAWWVAARSSHTFEAESPDECARAVMVVTLQSGLFSLLSSLSLRRFNSNLLTPLRRGPVELAKELVTETVVLGTMAVPGAQSHTKSSNGWKNYLVCESCNNWVYQHRAQKNGFMCRNCAWRSSHHGPSPQCSAGNRPRELLRL